MVRPTVIIVGGGGRGTCYANYIKGFQDEGQVVGVAEPRDFYRDRIVKDHNISAKNVFTDWKDAAAREKMADAAIICTQDNMHHGPAIAFADKGYDILLEKPLAPSENECREIVEAAERNGIMFGVCHVMRYTPYSKKLFDILRSGEIGEIASIQHLEPVGHWHQAHSFVRGDWRNEEESSFMLLAKSCHDIDWLSYIMDSPCKSVSSFGNLKHFKKKSKPKEAGDAKRCVDCAYSKRCAYSAKEFYMGRLKEGHAGWPVSVVAPEPTEESLMKALEDGPYGRCVYECDNDVVDHQVTNILYENGATTTFTMTAFTEGRGRETRIFGTKGEIYGFGGNIEIFDFLTETKKTISTREEEDAKGGHEGADYDLMESFLSGMTTRDGSKILTDGKASYESHRIVFAAERARRENCVVNL